APTNLTLHQAIEINGPIGCGDAPVFPGDVILGDSDGVIVIPAHLADEIANEAFEMTAFEDFVTEQVQKGRGIFGLYPATDEQKLTDFAAWRKEEGNSPEAEAPRWESILPHCGVLFPQDGVVVLPLRDLIDHQQFYRLRADILGLVP